MKVGKDIITTILMSRTHLRPTSKGQVTLPIAMRKQLNVGPDTLLDASIERGTIVLRPLQLKEISDNSRIYSSEEIEEFLVADQISPENAAFFKNLLKKS